MKPLSASAVTIDREVLAAVVGCILPVVKEQIAWHQALVSYVSTVLESSQFQIVREPMARGMEGLNAAARQRYGRCFSACRSGDQETLLRAFQEGALDPPGFPAHRLFEMLIVFAVEGFLSAPAYGGNLDGRGWDHFGYRGIHGARPCLRAVVP